MAVLGNPDGREPVLSFGRADHEVSTMSRSLEPTIKMGVFMNISKLKGLSGGTAVLLLTGVVFISTAVIFVIVPEQTSRATEFFALLVAIVGVGCFALGCLWAFYIKLRNYIQTIEQRQSGQILTVRQEVGTNRRAIEKVKSDLSSESQGLRAEIGTARRAGKNDLRSEIIRVRNEIKRIRETAATEIASLNAMQRKHLNTMLLLAVRIDDRSGVFSEADLKILAANLDQDYDPFLVYWLFDQYEAFDVMGSTAGRNLASQLRQRGYLEMSLRVSSVVAEQTMSDDDLFALKYRQSELEIYQGAYRVKIQPGGGSINSIPGHVLHIVGKSLPKTQSGYTLRTHYTAIAQRDAGLQVSVVNQVGESLNSEKGTADIIDDIAYYGLPGLSRMELILDDWLDQNIQELADVVRRIKPSLLHAHSDFFNAMTAQAVGAHFNIPVVYESRGFWEESWLSRTSQKFAIEAWDELEKKWGMPDAYALRQAREEAVRGESDRVFTLARVMEKHIVETGYDPARISIVPNAVSVDDFPVLGRDQELATEFGYTDDTLVVGYISSIVEYEGIDTLIEAYDVLSRATDKKVKLLLVGDGAFASTLKIKRESMGTSGVTFAGAIPHEEILRYYSLIDIFVVPRRPARVCQLVTPLKPFEAFSTGRVVVMSNVDALKEIAEDSGAAELFEAGNAESLANVLARLIEDDDRRRFLSEKGAEWVRQERTWKANAEKYLEVYGKLGVQPQGADVVVGESAMEAMTPRISEHATSESSAERDL